MKISILVLAISGVLGFIPTTEITFNRDFKSRISGPLQARANITIAYDIARSKCEYTWENGVSTWRVDLEYKINGVLLNTERIAWIEPAGYPSIYKTPTIYNVPEGEIELWFTCSNSFGKQFDSDFGRNYKFQIGKTPIISFKGDLTQDVQNGPIMQYGSVVIDYDLKRVGCVATGSKGWNVIMYYQDQLSSGNQPVASWNPNEAIVQSKPVIRNLEKGELKVWFQSTCSQASSVDPNQDQFHTFIVQ